LLVGEPPTTGEDKKKLRKEYGQLNK